MLLVDGGGKLHLYQRVPVAFRRFLLYFPRFPTSQDPLA